MIYHTIATDGTKTNFSTKMTFVDLVLRWVRKNLMLLYAIAIPVVIQTTQITKAITTISMLNEELFLYRPIWSLNGLYSILSRYDHPQSLGIHNFAAP